MPFELSWSAWASTWRMLDGKSARSLLANFKKSLSGSPLHCLFAHCVRIGERAHIQSRWGHLHAIAESNARAASCMHHRLSHDYASLLRLGVAEHRNLVPAGATIHAAAWPLLPAA